MGKQGKGDAHSHSYYLIHHSRRSDRIGYGMGKRNVHCLFWGMPFNCFSLYCSIYGHLEKQQ